ncbi:MAG TPA: DUF4254 domain-containing protein [Edaphobacter sp.]|nr:DUF4254 domain-containing protein [Edaphobacter sp.]
MELSLPNVTDLIRMQDETTEIWHRSPQLSPHPAGALGDLAMAQHRANFDLWHEEDKARDPGASDAEIAAVKRSIDRLNQSRNDLVEQIDLNLLLRLEDRMHSSQDAPLHSETPGMMVDRLSILALKIFHTREEAERKDADDAHRLRNRERLDILLAQRYDLASALNSLLRDCANGCRRFKLYRQMKMYNDPELNPAIYKHKS